MRNDTFHGLLLDVLGAGGVLRWGPEPPSGGRLSQTYNFPDPQIVTANPATMR
jgi:hypothetical protein